MSIDETLPVEIRRGSMVESVHRVDVAVSDAAGNALLVRGDWDRVIYARSSAKPVQALPLIESGAAEAFGLSDERIALACASHRGEPVHTERVAGWLGDIGLGEPSLECGPHRPNDLATADGLVARGEQPSRLHNNCSGKHTGFLTTAVHLGENPAGYLTEAHPVQARVTAVLSEMGGVDLSDAPRGEDGCGIPVIGMPIGSLARAMAQMADPHAQGAVRGAACGRIVASMARHPYLTAGRDRLDTALMSAVAGIATKTGAEGVHIAIVPWKKIGIAVKARCGSERAADAAILWALGETGVLSESSRRDLAEWIERPVSNTLGHFVGTVRAGS